MYIKKCSNHVLLIIIILYQHFKTKRENAQGLQDTFMHYIRGTPRLESPAGKEILQ